MIVCSIAALLFALNVAFASICQNDQLYVEINKKSGKYANEEHFEVRSEGVLVYSSPVFVDNDLFSMDICLPMNYKKLYTLRLIDTSSNSWSLESYIEVIGNYGHPILKTGMSEKSSEIIEFTLVDFVSTEAIWRYAINVEQSGWKEYMFDDYEWKQIRLSGTQAPSSKGSQYFRRSFVNTFDIIAYELEVRFKYGIAMYVNGKSILHENLPEGALSYLVLATSAYPDERYRRYYRNSNDIPRGDYVLAVEIHFLDNELHTVSFDCHLSPLLSSRGSNKCFAIPDTPSIYSSGASIPGNENGNIMDMNMESYWMIYRQAGSVLFYYENVASAVNMVQISSYSKLESAPVDVSVLGLLSEDIAVGENLTKVEVFGMYTNINWNRQPSIYFPFYLQRKPFHEFVISADSSKADTITLNEVSFLICSTNDTIRFQYERPSIDLYKNEDIGHIHPIYHGFSSCSVTPSLPSGVYLDETYCYIHGSPIVTSDKQEYTIYAASQNASTTVSISVMTCKDKVIKVVRVYGKKNAGEEWYSITDPLNNRVLYKVDSFSGQLDNNQHVQILCVRSKSIVVTLGAENDKRWYDNSNLQLSIVMDDSYNGLLYNGRYDLDAGAPESIEIHLNYPIFANQIWYYYNRGDVPENWESSYVDTNWLQGSKGAFNEGKSHISFMKGFFNMTSIDRINGIELSVYYLNGIIVSINGRTVFTHRVDHPIATKPFASGKFDSVTYRVITLPPFIGNSSCFVVGVNTVAVALVGRTKNDTTILFDLVFRLLTERTSDRVLFFIVDTNSKNQGTNAFDKDSTTVMNWKEEEKRYITISFDNNRKEWINHLTITSTDRARSTGVQAVQVFGKNSFDNWNLLESVGNVSYSSGKMVKHIYINNVQSYNHYLLSSMISSTSYNKLQIVDIGLYITPTANYQKTPFYDTIVLYWKYYVGSYIPWNAKFHFDFSIDPALPIGLQMDSCTGTLSGFVYNKLNATTYTVTSKNYDLLYERSVLSIIVEECRYPMIPITVSIQTNHNPSALLASLYVNEEKEENLVMNMYFLEKYTAYNRTYCGSQGMYTFVFRYNDTNPMNLPYGYILYVGEGFLKVYTDSALTKDSDGSYYSRVKVSTASPIYPFYSLWRIHTTTDPVPTDWMTSSFDDSEWLYKNPVNIGYSDAIVTYYRFVLANPSISEYSTMAVYIGYEGGIVGYLNGYSVIQTNIEEDGYYAKTSHNENIYECFFISLVHTYSSGSTAVLAFEHHRSRFATSAYSIGLLVSAYLLVSKYVFLDDTFYFRSFGSLDRGLKSDLLDNSVLTAAIISNKDKNYIQWRDMNEKNTAFNAFGFYLIRDVYNLTWSIFVKRNEDDAWMYAGEENREYLSGEQLHVFPYPYGILGYAYHQIIIDSMNSKSGSLGLFITDILFIHQKMEGTLCVGDGEYPSVSNGDISPYYCGEDYVGYQYRKCNNGVFSDVKYDKCIPIKPAELEYPEATLSLALKINMKPQIPKYKHIITNFHIHPSLPEGLHIDNQTGIISGIPQTLISSYKYTIYGENLRGAVLFALDITVRYGVCKTDDVFKEMKVGSIYIYDCQQKGLFGILRRKCIEGEYDGEWGPIYGICFNTAVLILFCLIAVVIICSVVYVMINLARKYKQQHNQKQQSMSYLLTNSRDGSIRMASRAKRSMNSSRASSSLRSSPSNASRRNISEIRALQKLNKSVLSPLPEDPDL